MGDLDLIYVKSEIKELDTKISEYQKEINKMSSIRSVLEAYVDSYTTSDNDEYDDLPF